MPNDKLFSEVIDEQEVKRQIDSLKNQLSEVFELIESAPKLFSETKGGGEPDKLSAMAKEMEKAYDQLTQSQQKWLTLQTSVAQQTAQQNILNQERTKQIKDEAREALGLNDAYKKLEQQYNAAQRAAKNMAVTYGENSQQAKEAAEQANILSNRLKTIDASVGQFHRNVGNYTGAVQVLQKQLGDVRQKMDDLTKSGGSNSSQMQKLQAEENLLNQILNKNEKGFASLTMEVRANERSLATMFEQGMQNSEAFKRLQQETANAKRQLAEFQQNEKLLSSTAPTLQAMTTAAKGLGGAYAVGAGAAALFADGDEKVEKELNKLVAIMTVLQGLNEVHELLEKKGAIATLANATAQKVKNLIMTGNINVTKQQAEANIVQAATEEEVATATKATSASMITLRGAMMATGIGLLLSLIPVVVSAMSELRKETKESEEEQKRLNEVHEESQKNIIKEKIEMQGLLAVAKDETKSKKERNQAIAEINEKYKPYHQNVTLETINTKKADDANQAYIGGLGKKALAQAYMTKLEALYNKQLEDENVDLSENVKWYQSLWNYIKSGGNAASASISTVQTALENRKKKLIEDQKDINDLQKHFLADLQSGKAQMDYGDNKKGKSSESFMGDYLKANEERMKAQIEIQKLSIETQNKYYQKIYEDEKNNAEQRTTSLSQFTKGRQQLNALDASFEIATLQSKLGEIEKIEKISSDKRTNEQKKLLIERGAINSQLQLAQAKLSASNENAIIEEISIIAQWREKDISEHKKALEEKQKEDDKAHNQALENEQRAIDEQNTMRLLSQAKQYGGQISALNTKFIGGGISEHEYDEQKQEIDYENQRQKILSDMDKNDNERKIALKNADVHKIEQLDLQQADFENQLQAIQTNKFISDEDKKKAKKKSTIDTIVQYEQAGAEMIKSIVDGRYERELNRIQEQINATQISKEKEIGAIQESTMSSQEKANQIAIINANAQMQEEELHRQQLQEKQKEAKFDKDMALFQIAINTGAAIMKAAPIIPLMALMGFMGGIQAVAVAAKPIPKYATGRQGGKAELAEVNELGSELFIKPTGEMSFGGGHGIKFLEHGEKIISHDEVNNFIFNHMIKETAGIIAPERNNKVAEEVQGLKNTIVWQTEEIKKAYAKTRRSTVINNKIDTGYIEHLNRQVYN